MNYKNYFTTLFPALTDPEGYYQIQKEINLKAVENAIFNAFAGKETFEAIVLPESIDSTISSIPLNSEKSLRVRPIALHDFILPEPCEGRTREEIKKIIALHPVAYPDDTLPIAGSSETPTADIVSGQIVECYFSESGPANAGNMRGLKYRLKKQSTISLVGFECLATNLSGSKSNFEGGTGSSMESLLASGLKTASNPTNFTEKERAYIEGSKTIAGKTSDGTNYHPRTYIYQGKVEAFKGKEIKNGLIPIELMATSRVCDGSYALFLVDVIDSFHSLALAFKEKFGQKLKLTTASYRTFEEQIRMKDLKIAASKEILNQINNTTTTEKKAELEEKAKKKKREAASPGTSNHGLGLAFDFDTNYKGQTRYQSETYKWMLENAPRYGFENPSKMQEGGSGPHEAWHIQWIKIDEIMSRKK